MLDGWYSVSEKRAARAGFPSSPDIQNWLACSRVCNPLLPRSPAQHGVRITGFMLPSIDEEEEFPLFIRGEAAGTYRYYGMYREPRGMDTIGNNGMAQVPKSIKEHWANKLGAAGSNGKSDLIVTALRQMWSKVTVGWWDTDARTMIEYEEDLEDVHDPLTLLRD